MALMLVRFYRKVISPWLPPACRFSPTCSEYALTAIKKYGAFRGGILTAWRIMRCQPLCKGGYDPVPEIRRWRKSTRKINNEHQGKT
ncbi:MAG: membrane protein insertion efficiency factor YidD [Victivallales bacterium]|nr:membrane protein insertion efficiency factor YidD [Victivallales bacterium]